MKQRDKSITSTLSLVIGLALIAVGVGAIFGIVSGYEEMAFSHTDHQQLVSWLRESTIRISIFSAMIAVGLCVLVVLFLHISRKTAVLQRETYALQKKNEAMEKLNQQTQKLAHHQRLQELGTLTSSIAHEFNNLLTPIMGYSLMALEKLPPEDDELYEGILEIYNASRRAKEIISRLSDLSRKNTDSSFREVSPDLIIRKTLDVAAPAKPENVEIKLDLNCWDQRMSANEIQLSQMFLNLIINGFHAMGDKKGTLSINTSFDENDIHIHISDTGCGIPEEITSQIFEPFFTTKMSGKGTGLGLAIVAQVVEDHNGKITLNSKVNEGSTFSISLPRTRTETVS